MTARAPEVAEQGRYEDRAEFERELEGRYNFPRGDDGFTTALGYVDSERDELVQAFWAWKQVGRHDGRLTDLLRTWERQRLGAELYASAHQVLLFAVTDSLSPQYRPRRYGRIQPNRTTQQRKESLNEALDAITRARTVPEARTVEATDERKRELREMATRAQQAAK